MEKNKISITIVRHSESLPSDYVGARLWRSGIIAKYFINNDHKVRWVISTFDHYNKINRENLTLLKKNSEIGSSILMLKTSGYKKNVSISRFFDHFVFGVKLFSSLIKNEKPDVIFCSYPTPDSAFFSVLYGKLFKVPVILDVRDQWPDVLLETFRGIKRSVFSILITPYNFMRNYSLKNATSIVAANSNFLRWARDKGKRHDKKDDFVSFIPFAIPQLSDSDEVAAKQILKKFKVKNDDLLISFGGTLGEMFDFDVLYRALEKNNFHAIKFIICGQGGNLIKLKEKFKNIDNVHFAGQINSNTLFSLMKLSDALYAPYKNLDNFYDHLPNKFMEYLASGKPQISSLRGYAEEVLGENNCGFLYRDEQSLSEVFDFLQKNKNMLNAYGERASKVYVEIFHPDIILKSIEEKIIAISAKY